MCSPLENCVTRLSAHLTCILQFTKTSVSLRPIMHRTLPSELCYTYYLHHAPHRAVDALQFIARTAISDPKVALQLFEVPFIQPHSEARWRMLIRTDVPDLLLTILLDERTYEFGNSENKDVGSDGINDYRIVSKNHCVAIGYRISPHTFGPLYLLDMDDTRCAISRAICVYNTSSGRGTHRSQCSDAYPLLTASSLNFGRSCLADATPFYKISW